MKFFVAASWEDRKEAEILTEQIESNWNWLSTTDWWNHNEDYRARYALEDLNNIKKCDVLIVHNSEKKTSGKFIEIGIALGLGIPVWLLGKKLTTIYSELVLYKGKEL